jgi:quercetin dioxygenase-like cupin family protein
MNLPDFIQNMSALDLPFPPEMVKTHVLRSDRGLMVIFEVFQDMALPAHSHLGQWGTVLEGRVDLTIDGATKSYIPGQSYNIPSGVEHSVKVRAGSKVMDIFEEPDRYPLKE